jgi:hypothetical protein
MISLLAVAAMAPPTATTVTPTIITTMITITVMSAVIITAAMEALFQYHGE